MIIQLMRNLLGLFLILASCSAIVYSQSAKSSRHNPTSNNLVSQHSQPGSLVEEFSFLIKDFKVDHQTEANNLNISVSFRYIVNIPSSDYPDFRLLAKDIETFLTNYPNEKDYWEIVNKQLTQLLLKKYPVIASLTCEVKADPTPLDPYVRASRVTRERRPVISKRMTP